MSQIETLTEQMARTTQENMELQASLASLYEAKLQSDSQLLHALEEIQQLKLQLME